MIALLAALAWAGEVVVWHPWRGDEERALREASDAWTARTGHTVDLVAIPFGGFDAKVETAVPRGNGPDALIAGHGSIGKWSAMDVLVPWTGSLDDLRPATVDAVRWEGAAWGVPLAYKSLVLFYDPAVVAVPPATTDDLIAQARAHTGGGSYGLAYQAAEPYFHAPWMHAFGALAMEPDGSVRLDTEAHARAFAFTRRLARDEGVMPPQPTAELVSRLYEDGHVAFVVSGPWFLSDVTRPAAAAPLPWVSEAGAPARPFLTVDAAYVAAQARHPDLAADWIAFLAGPEGARIRQDVGHQAVTHVTVVSDDPLLRVLAVQSENAVPLPADPRVGSVWEALARSLRRVIRGAVTPDGAAIEAQAYEEILDQPRPEPADPRPYLALGVLAAIGATVSIARPLRDGVLRRRIAAHASDYLWVLPAALGMFVLVVLPFVTGATVSLFAHWRGTWTFVGFAQFADILLSRDFPITSPMSFGFTLAVTVLWTLTNVALHVAIGVALALLLREPWIRLPGVWRALLIVPWAVPNYITALVWKGMFHAQYGAINAILSAVLGPTEIDWFGSFSTAFAANLATNTWLGFPFMMVVTLGALQSIPRDLEEAAEVDGAGWWLRFRHVTWPLLRPALLPAVILGSVWTFNLFNVVYLVSGGEPDGSTEILISEAYRWAFSRGNRYGYAAAYAVIIFGVLLLYARGANRLAGRRVL